MSQVQGECAGRFGAVRETFAKSFAAGREVGASFAAWLVAWPAAKLAAYIPIGIAGIGIRESAMVALLGPLGGAAGPVLAASLLWDGVLIVGAVAGWFALCVLPGLRPAARRFQNS